MPVDPRLSVVTKGTVNNRLAARAIRHATALEGYKNAEVRKIISLLNDGVIPDLLSEYQKRLLKITQRGFDTSASTTKRLRDMIKATDGMTRGLISQVGDELAGDLSKLALAESDWQLAALTDVVPVKIDFLTPSPDLLRSIVEERPFDGHLMKDWFDKLATDTQHKVVQQVQIGLVRGDTVPQLVNRIAGTKEEAGVMDITRRNAEAIVRTAATHTTVQAREITYEENDDSIKGIQIVATLDARTTEICMGQDGKIYPVGEGPRPPFHYNCRSTTVPVLKSWKELGINLKEAPDGTRASMDGQVPEKVTYGDWLKDQSEAIQNEALGPARAELFRNGEVTIDQFVNDKGKLLTLDELRKK
jgi:SPP1 gp7 family putative phage head morphogenesis protein